MKSRQPFGPRIAVVYARVSSEEQEKEGYSIPAQQKLLHDYAAQEGIKIVSEFLDVETAKMPGRLGFDEMVEFFRKGLQQRDPSVRCRTLLVEKTDRLYRNLKDYVTIDDLKIDIHFVKENQVLSPDSHSSEKFMHGIKVLMAKNYIDNLSEETSKGLLEKAEQGIWPLRAPIGYRNVVRADGKKVIEPDPETASLIVKLFEWYATGKFSLEEVSEKANDAGLLMPRSKRPLNKQKLHRILRGRLYYGEFVWKGRLYKGIHEPIVTRELWDRVQAMLDDRGKKKLRKVKHKLAFSGLIQCGHCGCALVGEIQKGRYVYYHCSGFKGKCEEPYVREEVLEQRFTQIIKGLIFDAEVLAWLGQSLRESHQDEREFHFAAVTRLNSDYARLQARIEQMYVDKLDGRIETSFFDQKSAGWRDEQRQILRAVEQHQLADQSYLEEGVALLELATRAAAEFAVQDAREKRHLLDFVLSNCTWKGGELTPVFRQPFDIIADGVKLSAEKKAAGISTSSLCLEMGG
jgi:DNA invertase Pin-like site-specific DNA recombinase